MTFTYRRPASGEADDLAVLHVRCWQDSYYGILDADFLRTLSVEERAGMWRRVIADPEKFALAVYVEGAAVGFIMSGPARAECRRWAEGEVYALYLLKHFQRQGLGCHLLTAALDNWRQRGGASMAALVISSNHGARTFYKAMGGRVAGECDFELGGQKHTEAAYIFSFGRL